MPEVTEPSHDEDSQFASTSWKQADLEAQIRLRRDNGERARMEDVVRRSARDPGLVTWELLRLWFPDSLVQVGSIVPARTDRRALSYALS